MPTRSFSLTPTGLPLSLSLSLSLSLFHTFLIFVTFIFHAHSIFHSLLHLSLSLSHNIFLLIFFLFFSQPTEAMAVSSCLTGWAKGIKTSDLYQFSTEYLKRWNLSCHKWASFVASQLSLNHSLKIRLNLTIYCIKHSCTVDALERNDGYIITHRRMMMTPVPRVFFPSSPPHLSISSTETENAAVDKERICWADEEGENKVVRIEDKIR